MRTFATDRVQRADVGPPERVVILACGDCRKTLAIASKSKEPLPADFVHRQASIKGWHVGKSAHDDRCPDCLHRRKITQPKPQEPEPMQHKTPVQFPVRAGAPLSGADTVIRTVAREMSRDDRRIIFAKVDEVYTGDHYSAGWTDKRIAEDLNVPRAWVENIRAEFFGEARDNEEVRGFLDELSAVKGDLDNFAVDRQALIARVDDLTKKITRLLKIGEDIRKSMTP